MKKLLTIITCLFAMELTIEAHGGGGGSFHGGGGGSFHGGGYHGGASRSAGARGGSSRSSRTNSTTHNGNHGNTYNHTNNFYGGRGYGYGGFGWGAAGWGMFGFTMVATTSALLVASSNGRQNNSDIQNALISSQVEIEQLQKRIDELENKQNDSSDDTQKAGEQSPLENPKAIKAYMEELKANQIKLKGLQAQQSSEDKNIHNSEQHTEETNDTHEGSDDASSQSTIEYLQNKIKSLKAQLYDYWSGDSNNAA